MQDSWERSQKEEVVLSSLPEDDSVPKRKGGRWSWCVGLVGKPSAGKSTYFNAVAGSELAKVGATPFTTIDPNVYCATVAVDGPVVDGTVVRCPVSITIKDVAGLVPGAYLGRGRGKERGGFLRAGADAQATFLAPRPGFRLRFS